MRFWKAEGKRQTSQEPQNLQYDRVVNSPDLLSASYIPDLGLKKPVTQKHQWVQEQQNKTKTQSLLFIFKKQTETKTKAKNQERDSPVGQRLSDNNYLYQTETTLCLPLISPAKVEQGTNISTLSRLPSPRGSTRVLSENTEQEAATFILARWQWGHTCVVSVEMKWFMDFYPISSNEVFQPPAGTVSLEARWN